MESLSKMNSSYDMAFEPGKTCHICNCKFGNIKNRRHHCRFCVQSVCERHSLRKLQQDGAIKPQRICDLCYKSILSSKVQEEFDQELERLQRQLQQLQNINDDLFNQNLQEENEVKQMEMSYNNCEVKFRQRYKTLKDQLAIQTKGNHGSNDYIKKLNIDIEETKKQIESTNVQNEAVEQSNEELKVNVQQSKDNKQEKEAQLDTLNRKLALSLPASDVYEQLCNRCQERVSEYYNYNYSAIGSIISNNPAQQSKLNFNRSMSLYPKYVEYAQIYILFQFLFLYIKQIGQWLK